MNEWVSCYSEPDSSAGDAASEMAWPIT